MDYTECKRILSGDYSYSDMANFIQNDLGFSRIETNNIMKKSALMCWIFKKPMISIFEFDDFLKQKYSEYKDDMSLNDFLKTKFSDEQIEIIKKMCGVFK